jgi:UDP-glucose 4-epimerase
VELRLLEAAESYSGRRILITGGLGFIGSTLAHRLVSLGALVTIVDSLIPEYGGNLFNVTGIENAVTVNISDTRDEFSLRYLVRDQAVIFNLAGQTSHLDSMREPFTDLDINCRAQLSLLETCRRYNPDVRIVFASTRQIYGRPVALPVGEDHPLKPVDVNGIHKLAGEAYHTLYDEVYGVRCCSLRLTNTYGPRMRIKDARQSFLGVWIRSVVQGEPFEVWGGDQLRDFTYVDDAVDALLRAAVVGSHSVYNLGGNQVLSLKQLAELLVSVNGRGSYSVVEFPPERKPIDIGDYYADYRRAEESLSWRPTTRLEDGLARTLDYYRQFLSEYL